MYEFTYVTVALHGRENQSNGPLVCTENGYK